MREHSNLFYSMIKSISLFLLVIITGLNTGRLRETTGTGTGAMAPGTPARRGLIGAGGGAAAGAILGGGRGAGAGAIIGGLVGAAQPVDSTGLIVFEAS